LNSAIHESLGYVDQLSFIVKYIKEGWRTYLLSRALWIGHYCWRTAKSILS